MQLQDVVIVTALVLGALMIISACWVWISQRRFGTPGVILCGFGSILAGLSIWTHVEFTGPGGMRVEVEKAVRTAEAAKQQAETATQEAQSAQVAALNVHDSLLASQRQLVSLSKAVRNSSNPAVLRDIQTNAATELEKSEALSSRLRAEISIPQPQTESNLLRDRRIPPTAEEARPERREPQ